MTVTPILQPSVCFITTVKTVRLLLGKCSAVYCQESWLCTMRATYIATSTRQTLWLQPMEKEATDLLLTVASCLALLHAHGIVHRDIKPENIILREDGTPVLIDFGIAKKVNELFTTGKSLTSPGQFIGKPYYAAPELLLGDLKQQSYSTDVYALGIVLFQLMTGHLPFEGAFQEVYEKQMHEKLPLSEVEDKTVRKIIEKATEKDQRKRYQSAAEFRVDLDRWISEAPKSVKSYKPARPPKPSRSSSGSKPIGKWIGIAAAGLVIVGLVVYFATRPPKPSKPLVDQPEVVVEEPEPVTVTVILFVTLL